MTTFPRGEQSLPEVSQKERPILFSAPMVRALLSGAKTMTRRVVKPQPWACEGAGFAWSKKGQGSSSYLWNTTPEELARQMAQCGAVQSPFPVGMRLWVRETWFSPIKGKPSEIPHDSPVFYCADVPSADYGAKVWPSIFMPRWASRITLEITGVKVERLQEITATDAEAEGAGWLYSNDFKQEHGYYPPGIVDGCVAWHRFKKLWQDINGPGAWDANPWCWAIEFKHITP